MFRVEFRLEGARAWTTGLLPQSLIQAAGLAKSLKSENVAEINIVPAGGETSKDVRLLDLIV